MTPARWSELTAGPLGEEPGQGGRLTARGPRVWEGRGGGGEGRRQRHVESCLSHTHTHRPTAQRWAAGSWDSQTHFLAPLPGLATSASCSGGRGGGPESVGAWWRPADQQGPFHGPLNADFAGSLPPPPTMPTSPQSCSDPACLKDPTAHLPKSPPVPTRPGSLLRIRM